MVGLIPEPVSSTFATITLGMVTNIASDIVKYRAQALEGTPLGPLLKWCGLVGPNFDERLRETLKQALELYFKTYPQYKMNGIDTFFSDPAVAQQIGNYILDRQPIDVQQIQQALNKHLTKDTLATLLLQKRHVDTQKIVPDFLVCYRRVLNMQLSVPEMVTLLAILDQNDKTLAELRASEELQQAFLNELKQTRLSPKTLQAEFRASQQAVVGNLTQEMHVAKLVQTDEAIQTIQKRLQSLPRVFTDGLCRGRVPKIAANQYFVSHGFQPDTLVDWRKALAETLAHADKAQEVLTPYFTGDTLMGGYRLCSICEKLFATRFSIFLLPPSQDRNVYLELGIALGLRAPFLLIQHHEAKIPTMLEALNLYESKGAFRRMRQELPGKIEDYIFGVVHMNRDLPEAGKESKYLIAPGKLVNDEDVEGIITDTLKSKYSYLDVVSLTKQIETTDSEWQIEQLIDTIQTTRFAIYRVNESCSPMTFVSLGISIALNRPFLMIRETRGDVPADLRGIGMYQFPNTTTLEENFLAQHKQFFDKYTTLSR